MEPDLLDRCAAAEGLSADADAQGRVPMRMRNIARDERGATAVFILICLVVLVALVALSLDGGLLYSKLRQVRRANDAAALAAAIECVTNSGGGIPAANTKAGQYAVENGAGGTPYQPNAYLNGTCAPTGGKVTVYYGAAQDLMFGPAVGISSPKQVARSAVAVWGPAGGTDGIAPLMLSANRLS